MNYFKWHIGDYASATDHLSWDEDQAYTRMLRVYYRDERPLPLEPKQIYRLARAQTRAQREAVDVVLAEFFTQQEDGWHNKRCDEELDADRAFIEKQRANGMASAAKRKHDQAPNGGATVAKPNGSHYTNGGATVGQPPTPTPTPTPTEDIPTPTPPKGGAGRHRRSPERAEKDAALEVWHQLIASDGSRPPRDGKLQAAIDAAGGWSRIAQREHGMDESVVRKAFCDAYRERI